MSTPRRSSRRANPARPRQRRKDARPSEIIAASLAEFVSNGFAATKLDDIARRAGIVKGTIYRYFATKEALFEAALRSRIAPMHEQLEQLVDTYPGPSSELLGQVLDRLYHPELSESLHELLAIIIAEGARFPEITRLYYEQTVSRGKRILERIVARGIERGEIRDGAAARLPIVIMAPLVLSTVWRMTFGPLDPVPLERFAAAHRDLVLHGLVGGACDNAAATL